MTVFADHTLAARLEGLCADEMERFVLTAREIDPTSPAAILEVGGGRAVFVAPGSPVNQAFEIGMAGAVSLGDVAAVEAFFEERGSRPLVGVCPLAHPSLFAALGARGWVVDGFET